MLPRVNFFYSSLPVHNVHTVTHCLFLHTAAAVKMRSETEESMEALFLLTWTLPQARLSITG